MRELHLRDDHKVLMENNTFVEYFEKTMSEVEYLEKMNIGTVILRPSTSSWLTHNITIMYEDIEYVVHTDNNGVFHCYINSKINISYFIRDKAQSTIENLPNYKTNKLTPKKMLAKLKCALSLHNGTIKIYEKLKSEAEIKFNELKDKVDYIANKLKLKTVESKNEYGIEYSRILYGFRDSVKITISDDFYVNSHGTNYAYDLLKHLEH